MATVLCPKCGMEALDGKAFWKTSRPHCSFCGWNIDRVKEDERKSIRQPPWAVLIAAAFFGAIAYFSKETFAVFPFLFLSTFIVVSTLASWWRLKRLEMISPNTSYATSLSMVETAKEKTRKRTEQSFEAEARSLRALRKPRSVHFKMIPRAISVAFGVSWIFIVYWGFQITANRAAAQQTFQGLWPLLLFVVIWSMIGFTTIYRALKDRRLLASGDVAIATVTSQRSSEILYRFLDQAGSVRVGTATDNSRTLYEDMLALVFYNPDNPDQSVPLLAAACELKRT